nr:hypothetical protein [Saprospiraceae bacterium]MBP7680234.1 hypothetical protein [Saprospiraceae bacterium]
MKNFKQMLALLAGIFFLVQQSASAQCPLVCNDHVNVSLSSTCSYALLPQDVLENYAAVSTACAPFTVEVKRAGVWGSATLTAADLCQTLEYRVSGGGNTCWGTLLVEDKIAPAITCTPDDIQCSQVAAVIAAANGSNPMTALAGLGVSVATATTAACGTETWSVHAVGFNLTDAICQNDRIEITYGLTQTCGGLSATPCTQVITVTPLSLEDVDDPLAIVELPCGGNTSPSNTGSPLIGSTPLTNGGVCNILATYTDTPINNICSPVAGMGGTATSNAYKILRDWRYLDWCTGETETFTQVIKILDQVAPTLASSVTTQPDYFRCGERVTICKPTITDACTNGAQFLPASFTITPSVSECVQPILATQYANLATYLSGNYSSMINIGTPTSAAYYNASTKCWTLSLPAGSHSITYSTEDPCGNIGTLTQALVVSDRVDPNPVSPEFLQTTLNPWDCQSDVYAASFNQGSWDNCGIIRYEVRRQARNATTGAPSFNSAGQPIMENWASASATAPAANREYVHVDGLD